MRWPLFEATYEAEMKAQPDVFGAAAEGGAKRRADLQLRVVEHNVLTVAKYYTRISMARLAELLDLPQDKVGRARGHDGAGPPRRGVPWPGWGAQVRGPARAPAPRRGRGPPEALGQTKRAPKQAEDALSKLVVSKAVTVKIDRPSGIVAIGKKPAPEDVLNAWASNIGKLLGLVDKATQMISKESMVYKVPLGV